MTKLPLIATMIALIINGCSEQPETSLSLQRNSTTMSNDKPRVTGIGGIFFKTEDPDAMRNWYRDNLGLATNEYGSLFEFREGANPDQIGYLQWSPFGSKTEYFKPSDKEFMINYRVHNIEALVIQLKEAGVEVLDDIETYDYGKFVHILDPDGNKLELWEPIDSVFTETNAGNTTK